MPELLELDERYVDRRRQAASTRCPHTTRPAKAAQSAIMSLFAIICGTLMKLRQMEQHPTLKFEIADPTLEYLLTTAVLVHDEMVRSEKFVQRKRFADSRMVLAHNAGEGMIEETFGYDARLQSNPGNIQSQDRCRRVPGQLPTDHETM